MNAGEPVTPGRQMLPHVWRGQMLVDGCRITIDAVVDEGPEHRHDVREELRARLHERDDALDPFSPVRVELLIPQSGRDHPVANAREDVAVAKPCDVLLVEPV